MSASAVGPYEMPLITGQVVVTSVVDPLTFVVTPVNEVDPLYSAEVTVQMSGLVAPAPDACGYDEAMSFVESTLLDQSFSFLYEENHDAVWIDEDGGHQAQLLANGSWGALDMACAGMLTFENAGASSIALEYQTEAQESGAGLWSLCAGFPQ